MNTICKSLLFSIMLVFAISACTSGTSMPPAAGQRGSTDQQGGQAALQREAQSSYSSEFKVQFRGIKSWSYQLNTRKNAAQREIRLHLDGLDQAQNPGDIRLVTDGANSWMTGPGTDGECIQFPNLQGMDPSFIYPESLAAMPELGAAFQLVAAEAAAIGSLPLLHFRASGVNSGPWTNATIDIWQEQDSGMLHQFKMQADGQDPYFAAGAGRLTADYHLSALDEPVIEPVVGCEISVKLPEAASKLVRLPDMASFEIQHSIADVQQYYQTVMLAENWTETAAPDLANGAAVLSYRRDAQEVQIFIETGVESGSKVTLLFMPVP